MNTLLTGFGPDSMTKLHNKPIYEPIYGMKKDEHVIDRLGLKTLPTASIFKTSATVFPYTELPAGK